MLNNTVCHDVCAVIVTYNPNTDVLIAAINAIACQVSEVFIVDNASSNYSFQWLKKLEIPANVKLHLIQQDQNKGVAAGHNVGMRCAIDKNAKFIVLMDQDSLVAPDMVFKLREAYTALNEQGVQVAAIGPQYRDADNGALSQFVKLGLFRFNYCEGDSLNPLVDTDLLVSSGSLISVTALEEVGLMDEALFIDHIDTEWCFRAKSKGMKIFGLCGAMMTHSLGERRKDIWFLRKRSVPFHKPYRYYYMFRNSVLLYQRDYMSLNWKLVDMIRCLKMMFFFGLAAENRSACLKMMLLGILDGLRGVNGKCDGL